MQLYQKAIDNDSKNPNAHLFMGRALDGLGQF